MGTVDIEEESLGLFVDNFIHASVSWKHKDKLLGSSIILGLYLLRHVHSYAFL